MCITWNGAVLSSHLPWISHWWERYLDRTHKLCSECSVLLPPLSAYKAVNSVIQFWIRHHSRFSYNGTHILKFFWIQSNKPMIETVVLVSTQYDVANCIYIYIYIYICVCMCVILCLYICCSNALCFVMVILITIRTFLWCIFLYFHGCLKSYIKFAWPKLLCKLTKVAMESTKINWAGFIFYV